MTTIAAANDYGAGDTKAFPPDEGSIQIHVISSAPAAPRVGNSTAYIQDPTGAVAPLVSGVSSISNSDGTLTISPTTGAAVASRPAITGDVSVPAASNAAAITWPRVQAQVTGASRVYTSSDMGKWFSRTNSGGAMTDTMPSITSAMDGQSLFVSNDDAVTAATNTISAAAGQSFVSATGGVGSATFVQYFARRTQFIAVYNGGTSFWRLGTNNNNLGKLKSGSTAVAGNVLKFGSNTATNGNEYDDSGFPAALATITAAGFMAAADKVKCDNLWVDANNIGIDASFSAATNRAAFNTWYATAPNWVTLKFPADPSLYYDFDAELALNRDIRIRFLGDGKGRTILRTTSATANLFNQSVAGFYISFEELGFGATVNKTAGAAIVASSSNSLLDVRRCEFQNQFRSIDLSNTGGNLGVINECVFSSPATTAGGSQIRINGSNINMMIQNCTINVTAQDVIGLEILASGAVQVGNCDFIGGRNTMLLNSTGGGIAAVFCTNVFLDQATLGPTLLIKGTGTLNRIKFIGCGITNGANGTNAIEIAGTGTGTGIPEGIDFYDTDVYNNGFTGTTKGFLVTGVRGFTVRGSRISGFTQGFDITPYSANGITNFDISGNTIGPTENFNGNGTGILINAGAVQFGSYTITDNDISGNTTAALTDNGTIGATSYKVIDRNLGIAIAAQPNNPNQLLPITTATKVGRSIVIQANGARIGTRIKKEFQLLKTATASTLALTLRNGTGDANTDATVLAHTSLVGTAAAGFLKVVVEIEIVSATTCVAWIQTKNGAFGATTGFAATHEQVTCTTAAATITNINTLQYFGLWSVTTVAGNTSTVVSDDEFIRF